MKTFTILGTGWLGLELANSLKKDFIVKVSLRNEDKFEEMKTQGFKPFILSEDNFEFLNELLECNYLFINYPPSKFYDYISFLDKIFSSKKINNIEKIIFISSTSIYQNIEGIFSEDSNLDCTNSNLVYKAEETFKNSINIIFRASGRVGGNRYFGKRSAGKIVEFPNTPINFVHRNDVINVVEFPIGNDLNGIFNLSSQNHPTKKDIYSYNSKKFGFQMRIFNENRFYINRIIDGSAMEKFGFRYMYNDVFSF